jgi:hypothetical protein
LSGDGGGVGNVGSGGSSSTASFTATIVADNTPENCAFIAGTVFDFGSNLDSGTSCDFGGVAGDQTSTNPLLGALQDNGGPTFTMAPSLIPKSPVIDVVPSAQCPVTDQRGAPRTAPCDIGAYDTDQAPFTSAIDVTVSGSQAFESSTPTFTETNDAPNGVTVSGSVSCTTVDNGTPINSSLAIGSHTIDGSSCSGLVSSNSQYPIFPSSTVGATNGFVVGKDPTSLFLTAAPASEPFGSESSTNFVVVLVAGGGEELPGNETVTVTVGSASCLATLSPFTLGGDGHCTIANSALGAGSYTASVSYPGDTDLQASGPATAAFTVSLALTAPPLANPAYEVPYTTTITAGGATGATTFSETGTLPTGLTLSTGGVLSGTPTNAAQIGTAFPFTVTATDHNSPPDTGTQAYTLTLQSPCAAGLTTHLLTATSNTGNFTGVFCVNAAGTGTYIQGPVHGNATLTSSSGVTHITAFGADLALLGQKTTNSSTFTETAPAPVKAGTFTLS